MRLGFDLDEVVVDLVSQVVSYLEVEYGIEWYVDKFNSYNFLDYRFVDDKEYNNLIVKDLIKTINNIDFQMKASPFIEAKNSLNKLKRAGHKLYFITSRPKENKMNTFKWLYKNNIPFDHVEVIGHKIDKGVYGYKHKLDMYVDDLPSNLESMYNNKKIWKKGLLLLDKPWNCDYIDSTKYVRVKNWKEILRHVGIQNR